MYTGAEALFNRPYGALNLRDNVQFGWAKVVMDAFEFIVSVKVTDAQTAGGVQAEDGAEFHEDVLVGAVCNRCHGVTTDATGNGV
jgi:cytochrome c553